MGSNGNRLPPKNGCGRLAFNHMTIKLDRHTFSVLGESHTKGVCSVTDAP